MCVCHVFSVVYKKSLLNAWPQRFSPMFFSRRFIVLAFIFGFLIYFGLIFAYGIWVWFSFFFLFCIRICNYLVPFVGNTIFLYWVAFAPLSNIHFFHICMGLFLDSAFYTMELHVCHLAGVWIIAALYQALKSDTVRPLNLFKIFWLVIFLLYYTYVYKTKCISSAWWNLESSC